MRGQRMRRGSMSGRLYQVGIGAVWAVALLVFVNCSPTGEPLVEGTLNGGGRIVRANGTSATFTYHGSNCGAPEIPIDGKFNFNDKSAAGFSSRNGVMADGQITNAD